MESLASMSRGSAWKQLLVSKDIRAGWERISDAHYNLAALFGGRRVNLKVVIA